ncbi:MAG: Na/Pi cotransporter family protein [Boseongicola sp.]|nr:Na/Pi cotransporter family protein [Boseongicola sp.]MDE0346373.1 Na/Pi cotransporter family protein [Boseongicola sp.]MXW87030.1 Na/Pi cotransporter family protein [Boseongicola sp. SB0667_bin_21]MYI67981.1 Na/Pi cotransporter family protein [Boseongicola sp. SB0673_bin_14]
MIVLAAQLAAAVALLLWSVRLIRTGVERGFMPDLKRLMKDRADNKLSAAASGSLAAMLMQSSTAVALIGAGFAVSGMLAPHAALALLLGADLGAAIMAMVLFLPVQALIPFALLLGIAIFFNARSRKSKQVGRMVIGFALVLISLGMIRDAAAPIGANSVVQNIAAYFQGDLVSAFAIGALIAWAMHSSLAAVLTYAAFAATGLTAAPVAAALVIGANFGGGLIPFVLLWSSERPARLVAIGNLVARGGIALLFLALLVGGIVDLALLGAEPGQQAVTLHIVVNATLLALALPLSGKLVRIADAALPRHAERTVAIVSALDPDALDHAPLALACAQRELLRMAETVQAILVPVMQLFRGWDPNIARVIEMREDDIDRMHFETKIYISRLRENGIPPELDKRTLEIAAVANSLEEAGDRIAVDLVSLAKKMQDQAIRFSDQGIADLNHFHDQVVTNGQLALRVLTTGDAEAARQLVAEKDRIRIEEQKLQERHLRRLQQGAAASLETTNIHQDTLRLLKQVNAALSYVAYPIAEETGDLLGSRLASLRSGGDAA